MPRLDPFSLLCRQTSRPPALDRADLHLHTLFSDGSYTPAQVVELALRCGLCAVALTDHDTLAGIQPARQAAAGTSLEIVPGVEITTEHQGRELHLLAYFIDPEAPSLTAALQKLRDLRWQRFQAMIDRLRSQGVSIDPRPIAVGEVPGRRHLAEWLVRSRQVSSIREAFQRWLHDGGRADVPKQRLPIAEALGCVRQAGGVAAWAHPPENCSLAELKPLCELGLDAIEADYPGFRQTRVQELKALACRLGLVTTGGSDCHGPDTPSRLIGARTISRAELEAVRSRARGPGGAS